jgi:hypothetical protein
MARAIVLCALFLLPAATAAGKRVVLLGFAGAGGAEATTAVGRALSGRCELVSRARAAQEAQRRGANLGSATGRSLAARSLKVAALIGGSVSRSSAQWLLRVVVYSGHSGQQVGSAAFPMRSIRIDTLTVSRVATAIAPALARARPGPPLVGAPEPVARRAPPPRVRKPVAVAVRTLPVAPSRPPPARRTDARRSDDFDDGSDPDAGTQTANDAGDGDDPKAYRPKGREPRPARRAAPAADPVSPQRRPRREDPNSEDLGFDVADAGGDGDGGGDDGGGDGGGGRRRRVPRYRESDEKTTDATAQFKKGKSSNERPEWEKIVELGVGVMLLSREFDFNDPIEPKQPSNYRSGMVPALLFDGAAYPLALLGRGPLANLGIVASYYRVPVLRSQMQGYTEPVDTTLHQIEAGLRYRWNILGKLSSPTLKAGLSYGRLGFVIHWDPALYNVQLPNIVYNYLKIAILHLEVPFYATKRWSFGAVASFDYLYIFSSGDIEATDTSGYGRSSTAGIDIGGGLFASYRWFWVRATGFYRRVFYAFDNQCYKDKTGCHAAGGALDIYKGATLLAGCAF